MHEWYTYIWVETFPFNYGFVFYLIGLTYFVDFGISFLFVGDIERKKGATERIALGDRSNSRRALMSDDALENNDDDDNDDDDDDDETTTTQTIRAFEK